MRGRCCQAHRGIVANATVQSDIRLALDCDNHLVEGDGRRGVPRPTGSPGSYRPGLDGIRAIAVCAVIAYHLGAPWMPGGLLGVGVFFTLSGYLITSILVRTWERYGSMRLTHFWMARARRLLPAAFLVLGAVIAVTAIVDATHLDDRLWQSLFASVYLANWADIAVGDSYFDATAPLGPLDHLWSLSIEEQFYFVWPLLLWGLLRLFKGNRALVGAITAGLAAASFALLAVVASPGLDNTRAYMGTDTRAGGLLAGAALALLWRGGIAARTSAQGDAAPTPAKASPWLDAAGGIGLVTIVALMVTMPDHTMALYQWGLAALSIATVALVAAAAHPASIAGRLLGVAPLRWLGERSYGVYLWHLPVIVFLPSGWLASAPWLVAVVAIAVTVGISAASWTLIEDPIRRRGFRRAFRLRPLELVGPTAPGVLGRLPVLAGTVGLLVASIVVLAGTAALPAARPAPAVAAATVNDKPGPLWGLPVNEALEAAIVASPSQDSERLKGLTSCTSVLHIGDSSSMGLVNETSLPEPGDRIGAQYERIGVDDVRLDILGARSVIERYKGEPNARDAVTSALAAGFDGCFVVAMGLNEAANVAVGGQTGLAERIDLMQELIGDRPTMWVTVKTLRTQGPWANAEMLKMNAELVDACRRHPTLRVYDWASEAPDAWYGRDRIHFTSDGDRERARRIADALVAAFPADGPQGYRCVVQSAWGAP